MVFLYVKGIIYVKVRGWEIFGIVFGIRELFRVIEVYGMDMEVWLERYVW